MKWHRLSFGKKKGAQNTLKCLQIFWSWGFLVQICESRPILPIPNPLLEQNLKSPAAHNAHMFNSSLVIETVQLRNEKALEVLAGLLQVTLHFFLLSFSTRCEEWIVASLNTAASMLLTKLVYLKGILIRRLMYNSFSICQSTIALSFNENRELERWMNNNAPVGHSSPRLARSLVASKQGALL